MNLCDVCISKMKPNSPILREMESLIKVKIIAIKEQIVFNREGDFGREAPIDSTKTVILSLCATHYKHVKKIMAHERRKKDIEL